MSIAGGDALFREQPDWVRVVEALYALERADEAWARGVVAALRSIFPDDDGGAALIVLEHGRGATERALPLVVGEGKSSQFTLGRDVEPLDRHVFEALFYSRHLALTHSEALRRIQVEQGAVFDEMYSRRPGQRDALGIVARPEPGVIAFVGRPLSARTTLGPSQRRLLSHLALHLESAVRLRRRPEAVLAVITPEGEIVHREGETIRASDASERVRQIERVRIQRERRPSNALNLWKALLQGAASVIERWDGSRRRYLVVENSPSRRAHRALSPREIETVRMAARGLASKFIAYGLGISEAAVSDGLKTAAAKLGVSSRRELVRVASLLAQQSRSPIDTARLTATEREILEMVQLGLTNDEIAQQRARSVHTVANQVTSILEKTSQPSRRALISAAGDPARKR